MKKLIILSVAVSFALSGNVVNDLDIEQINKVNNNSNFSGGATVSQGQTYIQNDSTVTSLDIKQRDGAEAGNLIDNVTITGTNQLHQGLTHIDNSRVEYTSLDSKNEVKNVDIIGSTSVVTQGALFIGGESNVTGIADSGGGGMGIGGSGENIEITETNILRNTNIDNSTLHQGLTIINNQASVTNTFKLTQQNTINRASSTGTNSENNSTITQGHTEISGGTTSNIEQNIQNVMEDITVDSSSVKQSSMQFINSDVSNINNNNTEATPDDKNRITNTTINNNSTVLQSNISANGSTIDGLYKQDTKGVAENNWMHTVTVNNSTIKQSTLNANNGSTVTNITYKTHDSAVDAINLIYKSQATNSELSQDTTSLDNGILTNTTLNRANSINTVTANDSILKQFNVIVTNSTLSNSELNQQGLMWKVNTNNANITQGSTIITD